MMNGHHRYRLTICTLAGLVIGVGLMLDGVVNTDDARPFRLGLGIALIAGTALSILRNHVTPGSLERAWLKGYDDGLRQGMSDDLPQLSLVRAAKEFGQQQRVRRGADRVN